MKWVTWEHIGIDRMGCAWLIQRFIDRQAEFVFIASESTKLPEGYEPFDIPGVRFSHRGAHSSFHTLLNEYHLDDPLLQQIARIIDEADVAQDVTLDPRAEGLDLVCRGLRLISADDRVALER